MCLKMILKKEKVMIFTNRSCFTLEKVLLSGMIFRLNNIEKNHDFFDGTKTLKKVQIHSIIYEKY